MADFECASRNAARIVWPNTEVTGCWFHFTRAMRKNMLKYPVLSAAIKRNPNAKHAYILFTRLALLPPDKIEEGLDYVKEYIRLHRLKDVFRVFYK